MQSIISQGGSRKPTKMPKTGGSIEPASVQPILLNAKITEVVLQTHGEMDVSGTEIHPLTVVTTMTKTSLQVLCVVHA